MYEMPKCTCGEELIFDGEKFFDADDDIIVYQAYGHCPECDKSYQWKDVYTLTKCYDLKETE